MKLLIDNGYRNVQIEVDDDDLDSRVLLDLFFGCCVGLGYAQESVVSAMESFLETENQNKPDEAEQI